MQHNFKVFKSIAIFFCVGSATVQANDVTQSAAVPAVAAPTSAIATPALPGGTAGLSTGKMGEARKVEVDSLKKKYWEYNNGQALKVVQNRTYTKSRRLNLGITTGTLSNDPFITTYSYGGKLGYNFSEYLALNLIYWKVSSSKSSAYDALVSASGFGSNSNSIQSIIGAELTWSILYGKLSLLGMAILHFDLYFFAGAGQVSLQTFSPDSSLISKTATVIAPWIGVGEQVYLSHSLTLSVDYRILRYSEDIFELYRSATLGQTLANKTTYAGALMVGLNLFLF